MHLSSTLAFHLFTKVDQFSRRSVGAGGSIVVVIVAPAKGGGHVTVAVCLL